MAKKVKKEKKGKGLWAEFKEFINKGNAFMLAVGVVIGGAFSAIVNAVVNILLSVATWAVPGGLKGLVTPLPAANDAQKGLDGVGQYFDKAKYSEIAKTIGKAAGAETDGEALIYGSSVLNANYTLHGTKYYFNGTAIIDWGTLINAVISFIIIAVVLFIIVKVVNNAARRRDELKAKALEEYYSKHPEERPVPPEPGVPEPTEVDLLKDILATLKAQKSGK